MSRPPKSTDHRWELSTLAQIQAIVARLPGRVADVTWPADDPQGESLMALWEIRCLLEGR